MKKKLLIASSLLFLFLSGCNGIGGGNNTSQGDLSINTSNNNVTSENGNQTSEGDKTSSEGSTSTEVHAADKVFFHFKEGDIDFSDKALWVWGTNRSGQIFELNGTDDFGSYLEMNPKEDIGEDYVKDGIYLLVRTKNSWKYQTTDTHIKYNKYVPVLENGQYVLHVYFLISNNKQELMVFKTLEETLRPKVMYSYLDESLKKIKINADGAIKTVSLYKLPSEFFVKEINNLAPTINEHHIYSNVELGTSNDAEIVLDGNYELNSCYRVACTFVEDDSYTSYYDVVLDKVFGTTIFDKFVYEGNDLGVTLNKNEEGNIVSTTFKVWAPTSYYVGLNIYRYGHDSTQIENATALQKLALDNPSEKKVMTIDDKGVYSVTLDGDYSGKYYTYTIVNSIGTSETVDPYSYSSGINSKRTMIVNFDDEKAHNPEFDALPLNWDGHEDLDIESSLDLTIYETHIRDLTMDDSWSSNPEDDALRGTFKGFIKRGTTYTDDATGVTVKTGFDHLEELGVNAIQLIPVFDQDNIEQHEHTTFNWGYNPQLYNVVEGSYSSDPFDGYSRIREFKELVAAFANNENHTRIIMDVVYNHVSSPSTNALSYTCPKYYFRLNEDGSYREGSGCGNEIRTEAPMMRKFIVNSLKFWATEYKVKGFRFDLMGLIDVETLKLVKEELYEIDPDIVLYGEGWTGDGSWNPEHGITPSTYSKLYESDDSKGMVGAFNDCGRDAIRGGNGSWGETYTKPTHGFIAQGAEHFDANRAKNIGEMMKGINPNAPGANPEQTINYASCHDNYTLFDQLNWTLSDDGGKTEPNIEVVARASVAVNAMVFLSNGVAFMNGGEEIFRTKRLTDEDKDSPDDETTMYGYRVSHNSYTYSDECNSYKYERKVQLLEYFEMYKQFIQLRKELMPAFYPENTEEKYQLVNTWDIDDGDTALATFRKGRDGSAYFIYFNGRSDTALVESAEHNEILFNNSTDITYKNGYVMSSKYQVVVLKGA